MSYSIIVASVIPLLFLYVIKWLNFFETHKARFVLLALVWGAISVELSYQVDHPLRLALGTLIVGTRTAPVVEEVFKSLVLLYLVRRADTTFFVDGAVYGFAAGVGFAIAENMLYLSRVDVGTGVVLATQRAFVSSVLHGSCTAIVGMALAGFPVAGLNRHPVVAWLIGLAAAIAIHMAFNSTAFHTFVFGQTGYLVLAAIAFSALILVGAAVFWGVRRERRRLRKSLGMSPGVSKGERMLVRRIEDFDQLLAPIEERYGEIKREQAANALLLAAQLAMKQDQIRKTRDPELRAELAPQITQLKRDLKKARDDVGIYVMSYVRSIVPKPTWSIWARLGQILSKMEPASMNLWKTVEAALRTTEAAGETMHAAIQAVLASREQSAALAIGGEED